MEKVSGDPDTVPVGCFGEMLRRQNHPGSSSKVAAYHGGDDHKGDDQVIGSALSPTTSRRLLQDTSFRMSDSEDEGGMSPHELPPDVPKGSLAVYVGPEMRRFVIPTRYLSLPVFRRLLEKTEEEFGFNYKGALTIPCEIETFKYLLKSMEKAAIDEQEKEKEKGVLQDDVVTGQRPL